jgi:hypothetical protein
MGEMSWRCTETEHKMSQEPVNTILSVQVLYITAVPVCTDNRNEYECTMTFKRSPAMEMCGLHRTWYLGST